MLKITFKAFIVTIVSLCATALPLAQADSVNRDKPNIVLVVMDNFGYGEVGVYGGGELRGAPTPNIDSIAQEGFQLTNFNVEAECTPSRASLMTGRYGIRTVNVQKPPRGIWYGITSGNYYRRNAYQCRLRNWDVWQALGDSGNRIPTDQGFDEWFGIPHSSDQAFWPDSHSFQHDAGVEFTRVLTSKRNQKPKAHEVYDRAKRLYIDREITDRALDFIKRKAPTGQPFFCLSTLHRPMNLLMLIQTFAAKQGMEVFADVLAQTDTYVGELLGTIDKLGLKENTIFIFTSDNGREGVSRDPLASLVRGESMFSPYEEHYSAFFNSLPSQNSSGSSIQ